MKTRYRGCISLTTAVMMIFSLFVPWGGTAFAADENSAEAIAAAPGEVIVVYEKDCNKTEQQDIIDNLNTEQEVQDSETLAKTVADEGTGQLLYLEDENAVSEAVELLEQEDGVAYAQPNFRYEIFESTSGDPLSEQQYYLNDWDESFTTSCGAGIRAAWESVPEDAHVTIAVLDTGCLIDHEDLSGNIDPAFAYNALTGEKGAAAVTDTMNHGTPVTGIAGAVSGNGKGISGVAGSWADIIPVKIFRDDGGAYTSEMIAAFDYLELLMDSGKVDDLHVINMSLGGYGKLSSKDLAFESEITEMRGRDVLTVCAGGNGDSAQNPITDKVFPGDYEDCLCVTSLDENGCNSSFSDYNEYKDISAPGEYIISVSKEGTGSYRTINGTSAAAPVVSGIVGIMWAVDEDLTADEVVGILKDTANKVNTEKNDRGDKTGSAGAIDAAEALQSLEGSAASRADINDAQVTLTKGNKYTYTGSEITPQVTVEYEGKLLEEGVDYTVHCSGNKNVGQASMGITGIGAYRGTKSVSFTIAAKSLKSTEVHLSAYLFKYTGSKRFPDINVKDGSRKLVWGTDFTVSQTGGNSKSPGWNTIVITGKGNYTGSFKRYFRILPSGSKVVYPKSAGKTFKAGSNYYVVTKIPGETNPMNNAYVSFVKTTGKRSATVPNYVSYGGYKYKVTGIKSKALSGKKRIKTLTVKATGLSAASVKRSLTGSSVKYVKVKVGSSSKNRKYRSAYKKIFTRSNCGRKVKVK